jgi:hypothetical protein
VTDLTEDRGTGGTCHADCDREVVWRFLVAKGQVDWLSHRDASGSRYRLGRTMQELKMNNHAKEDFLKEVVFIAAVIYAIYAVASLLFRS